MISKWYNQNSQKVRLLKSSYREIKMLSFFLCTIPYLFKKLVKGNKNVFFLCVCVPFHIYLVLTMSQCHMILCLCPRWDKLGWELKFLLWHERTSVECYFTGEGQEYLFRKWWRRCLRLFNLTVWSPGKLNIKYTERLPPTVEILLPFFISTEVFFIIQKFQLLIINTTPSSKNTKLTADIEMTSVPIQFINAFIRIYQLNS